MDKHLTRLRQDVKRMTTNLGCAKDEYAGGGMLAVVIVLYKRTLAESESHRSLVHALEHAGIAPKDVEIIVYDNSPEAHASEPDKYGAHYTHDASNRGLVPAYNHALDCAHAAGAEWLLLLDQDTRVPEDYFSHFERARTWCESRTYAITSWVRDGETLLAPQLVVFGMVGWCVVPRTEHGLWNQEIVGINSGTFVRVSALRAWGGYPEQYTLDAVDHWFFAQTYATGGNVYLMDVDIEHALSVRQPHDVSRARWQSILGAETDYYLHMRNVGTRAALALLTPTRIARAAANGQFRQLDLIAEQGARLLKSVTRLAPATSAYAKSRKKRFDS